MEADTHEVCVSVLNRFVDVVCSLKAQGFEVNIFALISHKKNFIELTMFDVSCFYAIHRLQIDVSADYRIDAC